MKVKININLLLVAVIILCVGHANMRRNIMRASMEPTTIIKGKSLKVDVSKPEIMLTKTVQANASSQPVTEKEKLLFIAGEIHYFRIPHQLWADRLERMQLGGITVVMIPIEWATHEPKNGEYYFEDDGNIKNFLEEVSNLKMKAIIKIGPYIGAVRDLGGLPAWLLFENPTTTEIWLRTEHPIFKKYYERWIDKLFEEIKEYKIDDGGPIIGVQIEHDYGHYTSPCDKNYIKNLANLVRKFSEIVFIYTQDYNFLKNLKCSQTDLDYVYSAVRIANSYDWDSLISNYLNLTGHQLPFMVIFDNLPPQYSAVNWNCRHLTLTTDQFQNINHLIERLIQRGVSIGYLYTGGSNFGLTGGKHNLTSLGTIPSYGHNAPLTPTGYPTDQFFQIRHIIHDLLPNSSKYTSDQSQISMESKAVYPTLVLEPFASLISEYVKDLLALPPVASSSPKTFRQLQINSGFVVYEIHIDFTPEPDSYLICKGVRDRGYVYLRNVYLDYLDSTNTKVLLCDILKGEIIQILVENNGRLSKGFQLNMDVKGIHKPVYLDNRELTNWKMYPYPFDNNLDVLFDYSTFILPQNLFPHGPILFRGVFYSSMEHFVPIDSYINLQSWGKGVVFLNGRILGRYWSKIGPQLTLYVPGSFIHPYPKKNVIIILELEGGPNNGVFRLPFSHTPIFRA